MDREVKSGNRDTLGQTEWLASGMEIEDEQIFLWRYVRLQGAKPNVKQRLETAKKRQKLMAAINRYLDQAEVFLGHRCIVLIHEKNAGQHPIPYPPDDDPDNNSTFCLKTISTRDPEWQHMLFPSAISQSHQDGVPDYAHLINKELKLRSGQATDALQHICEALSQLAYQFRLNVRNADSTKQTSRAWDGVNLLTKEWQDHQKIYCRARDHILAAEPQSASKFPSLSIKDCQISAIAIDGNVRGQSKAKLSWLWTSNIDISNKSMISGDSVDEYILECECLVIQSISKSLSLHPVYRVHWLCARAQAHRWDEELTIVQHEMEWTVQFFMKQVQIWEERRKLAPNVIGAPEFALRQKALWNEMGRVADETYVGFTSMYKCSWHNQI